MQFRVLHPSAGNSFIQELLDAISSAMTEAGVTVLSGDVAEPGDDVVDLVAPHEYFILNGGRGWPSRARRRRTIALITEHPGTFYFDVACLASAELGGVLALNQSATVAARLRGLQAKHLQLGYVPGWDKWHGADSERSIDLAYMGISEHRRNRLIAAYSDTLWRWKTSFLIPPLEPRPSGRPDFLVGEAKWRHLADSMTLLNLHREGVLDTEWPRVLEAICNGAVVVTEHCSDSFPLLPGVHYVSASATNAARIADQLLHRPDELREIRLRAYGFLRDNLPPARWVSTVIDSAEHVISAARRPSLRYFLPPISQHALTAPLRKAMAPDGGGPSSSDRAALKRLAVDLLELRRGQKRLELLLSGVDDPDRAREVYATPGYIDADPRVSVIMPLYNHVSEVAHALEGLLDSDFASFEILIVDDASSDGSVAAAQSVLAGRPGVAAKIYEAVLNHGPSWARNQGIAEARGDYLFFLDSDNAAFPSTLGRLVAALDAEPTAAMVYPIVAIHGADGAESLISQMAWRPEIFLTGQNPIDTLAMVKRSVFADLGGFTEDPRLTGLEDYDLWCRMAAKGMHAVSVPEVLGWYRRSSHSVLSLTDIDRSVALSLIARRAPELFRGAAPR